MPPRRTYIARYLGMVPYESALRCQRALMRLRAEGTIPDVVLLLQPPHVYTVGRFKGAEDIIVPPEEIPVFHTERGGGITYHGPGQLVGYPILDLREKGLGVREYIWRLEEVIINLLRAFGLQGHRNGNYPGGVWVDSKKVCSIGIHVSHRITTHGFALNISNDLRFFEYIRPCGLRGQVMTSLSELLGHAVEIETVVENLLYSFSQVFMVRVRRQNCKQFGSIARLLSSPRI